MRHKTINTSFFIKNREKVINYLCPDAIAIFHSNDMMPRNGDLFFPFRQQSDFFYLTGIDLASSVLILCPGHPVINYREILFVPKQDTKTEIWDGKNPGKEALKNISGIENIYFQTEYEEKLSQILPDISTIYLNTNENKRYKSDIEDRNKKHIHQIMKQYPLHHYQRLAPCLTSSRLIKEKIEIELIRNACKITRDAFHKALKIIKPGIREYEIEAEMIGEFIRNGSNGHAFEPIIASGINACTLHYIKNNCICKDGELVLMDFGAEYANYASDCTRTIPVNGHFTKRQLEIYNSVLNVMNTIIKNIAPGITINELQNKAYLELEKELLILGIINQQDLTKQKINHELCKKYFPHGISHFIGLDVHDPGDKRAPLKAGMIISCEPGIYIPAENTGIRLENVILVTGNGSENLTKDIPIEPGEIEKLLNKTF